MKTDITIRLAGEAGQGMQTIGAALCRIFAGAGSHIFANQDYMSRIRGGNSFFQLRAADRPLCAPRRLADIVVALDKASVQLHRKALAPGGLLLADLKRFGLAKGEEGVIDVPFYELANTAGGGDMFVNSAVCGLLAGIVRADLGHVEAALARVFSGKSPELIKKNLAAAKAGYGQGRQVPGGEGFALAPGRRGEGLLLNGNEAVALGAIRAGCKVYTAYPMSPSTGIMETLARYAGDFGIVVEQAEDELAAVNMAIGASFAGARAMTASSGGGFALMTEGLSLAAMTETPLVIADVQRPGPATGFPTRTEQADLNLVLYAGHGEFARAVFSPGTAEQAFRLTIKAFDLAERFQIPVIILSDQHLAESTRDIRAADLEPGAVRRAVLTQLAPEAAREYKRYRLGDTCVSPRLLPSFADAVVCADSDEHTEEGHISEDAALRELMVAKRLYGKKAALAREAERPEAFNTEGADIVLLGFGSTYGVMRETAASLAGLKAGFIHLSQVWPFPGAEIARLLKGAKKAVTVENNASGQLAGLLRRETGMKVSASILKFDGRPFDADFLAERAKKEAADA